MSEESKSYQLTEDQRKLIVMLLDKYIKNVDTTDIRETIGDEECNRLVKTARLARLAVRGDTTPS